MDTDTDTEQNSREVYLDHASANPVLPEALQAMAPFYHSLFGNPLSLHSWGSTAREAIEEARTKTAALIGAPSQGLLFTSSGSEANNLAIKGIAFARQNQGKHIVISAIEHFSVLQSCKRLERWGFETTLVPVDRYGIVHTEELVKALRPDTILVSVMHANNEIGSIQPIGELSSLVKGHSNAVFHTDAVATAGIIPVNVAELGVDALSLAAQRFYGPKGAGALWLRRGVTLVPQIDGGVQEGGRRAGTEDVPAIVGMGVAAEAAMVQLNEHLAHLIPLRDRLLEGIPGAIEDVVVTGHPTQRLPDNVSFCMQFVEGEAILLHLDAHGVAASSGSSCTSRALKASHVLLATGHSHEVAQGSLLFTLGKENSMEDVEYVIRTLAPIVSRLRRMSPLYTKYLKGRAATA
ncbi:MAG: cysteine desulfurase [Chloroflexi bacterium]|nr:cysteine desulfurase [Chloroflexota bacterium]